MKGLGRVYIRGENVMPALGILRRLADFLELFQGAYLNGSGWGCLGNGGLRMEKRCATTNNAERTFHGISLFAQHLSLFVNCCAGIPKNTDLKSACGAPTSEAGDARLPARRKNSIHAEVSMRITHAPKFQFFVGGGVVRFASQDFGDEPAPTDFEEIGGQRLADSGGFFADPGGLLHGPEDFRFDIHGDSHLIAPPS